MADQANPAGDAPGGEDQTRRDFLTLTATAFGVAGAVAVAWPFVDSMNPAADVLALASIEVDLSAIEPGQAIDGGLQRLRPESGVQPDMRIVGPTVPRQQVFA